MGNTRSSVLGEGLSLSPARRGNAALEELLSSEDEAELWERRGTWRLRCCWPRLSGSSGGGAGERVSLLCPIPLPERKNMVLVNSVWIESSGCSNVGGSGGGQSSDTVDD